MLPFKTRRLSYFSAFVTCDECQQTFFLLSNMQTSTFGDEKSMRVEAVSLREDPHIFEYAGYDDDCQVDHQQSFDRRIEDVFSRHFQG